VRSLSATSSTFPLLWILLVGASVLGACQPGVEGSNTGVKGQVLMGPMCPVVQADQDCPDQPLEADLEIEDVNGDPVARGRSDERGQFQIALEPGEYVLSLVPPNPGGPPTGAPIPFRVDDGQWTTLTVLVDSGIR
jgi:hypothetical protein